MLRRLRNLLLAPVLAAVFANCGGGGYSASPMRVAQGATSIDPTTVQAEEALRGTVMVIHTLASAGSSTESQSRQSAASLTPSSVCLNCIRPTVAPIPTPRPIPTVVPTPAPTATPTAALQSVVITVPAHVSGAPRRALGGSRHAAFVSSSTNSVALSISEPSPGSPSVFYADCTPNNDGTKTCTINGIAAVPGATETYIAKAYDAAGEQGNLLSYGTASQTIVPNQANSIVVYLNPVTRYVSLVLDSNGVTGTDYQLTFPTGSSATFPVTVQAEDADGNYIPTPSSGTAYLDTTLTPFTISAQVQLDPASPAGTITLSGSTFASPASPTLTGTYNGATLGGGANINVTVSTTDPNVFVYPNPQATINN